MEIYSSAQRKQKAVQPRAIYYSRTKLILGTIIWSVALACFGLFTYRFRSEPLALALGALVTFGAARMLFYCIKPLGSLDTPALLIGRDGIRFDDGLLIGWNDIRENTYLSQSYMGIPTLKLIEIKTTLPRPKVKRLRVAALQLDSDEYLELCDSYSQGALPPATR